MVTQCTCPISDKERLHEFEMFLALQTMLIEMSYRLTIKWLDKSIYSLVLEIVGYETH